jgi:hypothetical protein
VHARCARTLRPLCPHTGDPAAEKEVEDLDKMIKLHPDYIKEEEEKERAWYGMAY